MRNYFTRESKFSRIDPTKETGKQAAEAGKDTKVPPGKEPELSFKPSSLIWHQSGCYEAGCQFISKQTQIPINRKLSAVESRLCFSWSFGSDRVQLSVSVSVIFLGENQLLPLKKLFFRIPGSIQGTENYLSNWQGRWWWWWWSCS